MCKQSTWCIYPKCRKHTVSEPTSPSSVSVVTLFESSKFKSLICSRQIHFHFKFKNRHFRVLFECSFWAHHWCGVTPVPCTHTKCMCCTCAMPVCASKKLQQNRTKISLASCVKSMHCKCRCGTEILELVPEYTQCTGSF